MTLPNFLVIGAEKSGTSSLYHYLKQHPEVFMSPVKEPNFFAVEDGRMAYPGPDGQTMYRTANPRYAGIEEYLGLFGGVRYEKAVGEASPSYIYLPEAAGRIKRRIPQAKLIAVLRDPAERAYSAYLHRVRTGAEPLANFSKALEQEEERMRTGWGPGFHYRRRGFYHEQLSRYHVLFDRDRIRVYLHEELSRDPVGVARDVFRFLGVDDTFEPDVSVRYNPAGVPRTRAIAAFVRMMKPVSFYLKRRLPFEVRWRVRKRLFAEPPPLDAEVREELVEAYREDVLRLQDLIGRDLSAWLKASPLRGGGGA